ncbi:hypothetical protein ACIP6P_16480 [Streptomyces sp. NPDC088729]|uniref:hypothetical protein n=1 Tax=Streptomyces sp. NPDC088729 TaxID=3365876 RepID=UPI0037FB07E0
MHALFASSLRKRRCGGEREIDEGAGEVEKAADDRLEGARNEQDAAGGRLGALDFQQELQQVVIGVVQPAEVDHDAGRAALVHPGQDVVPDLPVVALHVPVKRNDLVRGVSMNDDIGR